HRALLRQEHEERPELTAVGGQEDRRAIGDVVGDLSRSEEKARDREEDQRERGQAQHDPERQRGGEQEALVLEEPPDDLAPERDQKEARRPCLFGAGTGSSSACGRAPGTTTSGSRS